MISLSGKADCEVDVPMMLNALDRQNEDFRDPVQRAANKERASLYVAVRNAEYAS